jgi:hypothetical protein
MASRSGACIRTIVRFRSSVRIAQPRHILPQRKMRIGQIARSLLEQVTTVLVAACLIFPAARLVRATTESRARPR